MLAFGAAANRDAASNRSDVQARFDSVADCAAGLGMVTPILRRTVPRKIMRERLYLPLLATLNMALVPLR